MDQDTIVMTGAGMVTPLGLTRAQTWRAVVDGRCGIGPLTALESAFPGAEGGQAPELPADFYPEFGREARYLRHAILEAMNEAQISASLPYPAERCGIILGTTLHGMRKGGLFFRASDYGELAGFLAAPVLRDATQGLSFEGCAWTTCSACSSSLGAIALAMTMLRTVHLDLVLAGGYDAISEYAFGGFNSLRLVAPGPLRPFARDRQGMKLAEGYGIVVLERARDARQRSAMPIAKVLGYGESADAHHLTQPHPTGDGAARAIRAALADSGVSPSEIDMAAAHATGTPDNDAGEFAALSAVFGADLPRVPVVAFKSHLGHTLGGAGAVELILSAMALADQVVPACVNVTRDDIAFPGLNVSTDTAKPAAIRATLNTSLGFGGANTAMVLGATSQTDVVRRPTNHHDVYITGIGVVFPGIVGNEAFTQCLKTAVGPVERDTGDVPDNQIGSLLNARRVRRMSDYVKLSLAATSLCLRDAGIEDVPQFADTCAAVLGTTHGSTKYCEQYYGQIVCEGIGAANPMLFAEGVPNAAAAHLSLMLSLKGACQTIIGSRTSGLDAMRIAAARIGSGEWERAIVGAAEEYSPVVNEAYRHQRLYGAGGFVAGAGAVTFLVESRKSVESRGGRAIARVIGAAGGQANPCTAPQLARRIYRKLDSPKFILCSANGTWITRAEVAGLRNNDSVIGSAFGYIADCSSALALAGMAATLLTGCMPRQITRLPGIEPRRQSDGFSKTTRFATIAADYSGAVSAIALERLSM
ncbi:MAG TPA: beta-ketoacyl-[acyl-carrier-protein] synthase family protein [Tepidisphaeraceae bacterium]|jgi:3-oxoacyl-[acyl-carrier-protein] synthase II